MTEKTVREILIENLCKRNCNRYGVACDIIGGCLIFSDAETELLAFNKQEKIKFAESCVPRDSGDVPSFIGMWNECRKEMQENIRRVKEGK